MPLFKAEIIAASMESPFAKDLVSAQNIIAGYQQIIDRAHQHGIRVFIATILPYEGADYYTEDGEAISTAVNQWSRATAVPYTAPCAHAATAKNWDTA